MFILEHSILTKFLAKYQIRQQYTFWQQNFGTQKVSATGRKGTDAFSVMVGRTILRTQLLGKRIGGRGLRAQQYQTLQSKASGCGDFSDSLFK